jgi:adenine-specific DNA-methyltransferase
LATGVPKSRWNGSHEESANTKTSPLEITLAYEGKRTEADILTAPPAVLRALWQTPNLSTIGGNRLYYGDNLPILASLMADETVRGKVRLVYIDPPFATNSVFQSRSQAAAYQDLLIGAPFIEFLRERLVFLRELLAADGSIYLHLDQNMVFQVKVIMDEIFGGKNFRSFITRKKCNPKNYTRKTYGNISDYILFYTKSDNYIWHRPYEAWTAERAQKEYQYVEENTGRRYKKVPIHAPGVRNGETGQPWRGMSPPLGKHWQYPPRVLDEMDKRGEIYWSPTGNPRRKIYLDQSLGVPVQDIWLGFRDAHNQNIKITGYPTEKNSDMLLQIIQASSNPGDLVIDCFSGSGSTLGVAAQLGRRWIGIDDSEEAIATTLKRFSLGVERMGDFVEAGRPSSRAPDDSLQLSIWCDIEPPEQSEKEVEQITPTISDFALLAAEPYRNELASALELWHQFMGRKGS